jgi:hypothetical protein
MMAIVKGIVFVEQPNPRIVDHHGVQRFL